MDKGDSPLVMRVLWPPIAVVGGTGLICAGGSEIGPAVRGAHGDGRPGTLRLEHKNCAKGHCTWSGTFEPTGGSGRLREVKYSGDLPPGAEAGTVVPALATGSHRWVYDADGDTMHWGTYAWWIVLGLVLIVAGIGFFVDEFYPGPRRRPRRGGGG